MALITYPLNNLDFSAEDVELYFCPRTSGIYAGDDFGCSVTGADNNITIDVGLAWIRNSKFSGKVAALKSAITLDMGIPDSVYPRIDAVVIQFSSNQNATDIVVKKGTPASAPAAPAVSRTEALYELHLFQIRREAGAAAISVADITDLRLDVNYCGLMADSVTQVDTAAINSQAMALIQKLRADIDAVKDGSAFLMRDGSTPMTGPLNMNGQPITGLNDPTEDTQAARKAYADKMLPKSGGTMTGSIAMGGNKVTDLGTPTAGTDAAHKTYVDNAASKASTPYNLLDNSDFTRFVAQAGIGGAHGTQAYAGDRWILDSGTVTGTANANGEGYTNITLNGTIRQKLATVPSVATVGIEMVSGTAAISYADGAVTITSDGGVVKDAWCYPGTYTADNMPAYRSNGYTAELANCKEYYCQNAALSSINEVILVGFLTDAGRIISVALPGPDHMRITPTVSFSGSITVRGSEGYATEATVTAPYANPSVEMKGHSVVIFTKNDATAWGGITNNTVVSVSFSAGSILSRSADL